MTRHVRLRDVKQPAAVLLCPACDRLVAIVRVDGARTEGIGCRCGASFAPRDASGETWPACPRCGLLPPDDVDTHGGVPWAFTACPRCGRSSIAGWVGPAGIAALGGIAGLARWFARAHRARGGA